MSRPGTTSRIAGGDPSAPLDDVSAAAFSALPWRTRDGRMLTWGEMSVDHLRNVVTHLTDRNRTMSLDLLRSIDDWRGERATDRYDEEIERVGGEMRRASRFAELMTLYADWRDGNREVH